MTLGDGIKERLLDITALTTLVGQRVFELVLPQNEKRTAVRFQVLGASRPDHLRGPVNQVAQRVQVDVYVPIGPIDPLGDARAIADAVRGDGLGTGATGFWGWVGTVGGSPEAIEIRRVELLDDGDALYESDEIRRVRIRQDYRVHWRTMT